MDLNNDINVLNQLHVFDDVFQGRAPIVQLQNYKKVLNFGGCSLFGDSLNLECFLVQ